MSLATLAYNSSRGESRTLHNTAIQQLIGQHCLAQAGRQAGRQAAAAPTAESVVVLLTCLTRDKDTNSRQKTQLAGLHVYPIL